MYGSKQSLKTWFDGFTTFVKSQGCQGHYDHTLFTERSVSGEIVVLIVYVDDIVLLEDDTTEITRLKKKMADDFEIEGLENLKYFLGIEVGRSREGISVSQRKYTIDLLKEIGMTRCRPANTPIELNVKLGDSIDKVPLIKKGINV